ncbi:MAG: hypothetical protein JNK89_05620, partial [Saprospiraceae bacterium]|nr:hypothetical protein [Saprospiraceae bacterium]
MYKSLVLLAALLVLPTLLSAQKKTKTAVQLAPETVAQLRASEDTLAILAFAVVNDSQPDMRFMACKALITKLVQALKTENSFHYPFSRLNSVSILYPPDSSFRIFTWQLFVDDSTHRYYGAIQMKQPELRLFPLIDRSFEMPGLPVHTATSPDFWYGALYYNLLPFDTREGRKYLLFGFDGYTFFDKRKVLEVLSFDAEGKPVFGAPVFEYPDGRESEQRIILEYSSEARVRLNWDEQYQVVLLDHLIPYPNPYTGGIMYIPDGSYDAYKLEKGRWKFIDKIFNDVQEEAPRPEPVLDTQKGKNILGTPG